MKSKTLSIVALVVGLIGCTSEAPVEAPSFSSVTVVLDSGETSRPTVAVSASGDKVFWTWIRKDDDGWNVYVSRADDSALGRTDPVRVNHIPGNANPHAQAPAQVSVGGEGNVYVAWTNSTHITGRRFPASDLLFSRSTDGGISWSAEKPVNSDAGGAPSGHTFHNMTTLADGTVLVSWIDSRERDRLAGAVAPSDIEAAKDLDAASDLDTASGTEAASGLDAGSSEARATTANSDPDAGSSAEARASSAGQHQHEMQHERSSDAEGRPIGSQIRVARSTDGGQSFVETSVVDHSACPCCRTTMAVSKDGVVYLAWRHEFENGARDPVMARSDDGGLTFSDPVVVSADNWVIEACPHAGPGLLVDDEGVVHVSWFSGADSGVGLFTARSTDGGQSFEPKELLKADQPVSHTAHAMMAPGFSAVAAEQVSPRQIDVFTAIDGTSARQLLSSVNGKSPSFAGSGGVSAMAYEGDGGIASVIWRQK